MKKKPQAILKLEKELDVKFVEKPLMEIIEWKKVNSYYYTLSKEEIIGLSIEEHPYLEIREMDSKLISLTHLNLRGNNLKNISFLKELKNITWLDLSSNRSRYMTLSNELDLEEIQNTKMIIKEKLRLNKNWIKDISVLRNLIELRFLNIENNEIENIQVLSNLHNLEWLCLGSNKIKDISPLQSLNKISELLIYDNQIKDLTSLKHYLTKKNKTIEFGVNPIKSPPLEIIKQGKQAIKDWFDSPRTENNEIKLILTGNTTAGKTTLINFLTKGEYTNTTDSTHGIQIKKWKIDNLNVNIWDFGGQEYYHATHRLFLTSNSVYLLLWEKSKNKTALFPTEIMISGKTKPEIQNLQHYNYIHWLNLIRRYTTSKNQDSRSLSGVEMPENFAGLSPIIMLQNKIDDTENNNQEEPTSAEAIKKYAVIKDYHISIKEAYNQKGNPDDEYSLQYRIFKNNLIKTLQETAKGREIQVYIANVREKIREHAEENIWNWQQYKDFCYKEAKAEMTDERMKILTQYLHDTGVILYYGYDKQLPTNSKLKDNVFINPSYVTQTIYEILDYKVQDNKGKFTKQDVVEKLKNKDKAETFIALMQSPNFELIFEYPDEPDTYFATQYLSDKIEKNDFFEDIIADYEISFVLKFNSFFSMSIMTRFIARYGFYSEKKWFAKQEILLKRNNIRVFVECNFKEQKIFVKTATANKKHQLIKEIFDTLSLLSNNDHTIELSLNKQKGFSLKMIYDNPEKFTEYKFLITKTQDIMTTKLSKDQFKKFQEILMDIYRTPEELTIFVKTELGENRHAIAGGTDLRTISFNLIDWAEAKSRLTELITATLSENPNNDNLKKFAKNINLQKQPQNTEEENSSKNKIVNQFGEKSIYIEKNEGNITIK